MRPKDTHTDMSQCLRWACTKIDWAAFLSEPPTSLPASCGVLPGLSHTVISEQLLSGHLIRNTVVPRKRWPSLVWALREWHVKPRAQLARNPELASLGWVQLASFSNLQSGIPLSMAPLALNLERPTEVSGNQIRTFMLQVTFGVPGYFIGRIRNAC